MKIFRLRGIIRWNVTQSPNMGSFYKQIKLSILWKNGMKTFFPMNTGAILAFTYLLAEKT